MADTTLLLSDHFGSYRRTGEVFDIVFERLLPHPVESVWAALTQPDKLALWLGEATLDLTPGGTVTIAFQGMPIVGQILHLQDNELLEYTWTSPSFPGEISVVRWELTPLADTRCRLQFTEKLVSAQYLAGAGPGWHYVLDMLELALDGKPIPVWNDNTWQQVSAQAKEKYQEILTQTADGEAVPNKQAEKRGRNGERNVSASKEAGRENRTAVPDSVMQENPGVDGDGVKRPTAQASLLIRKPAAEVYEALIDPAITTKFWFSRGSGRLQVDKTVTWYWDDYGVSAEVHVQTLVPRQQITWTWPAQGNINSTVNISFVRRGEGAVFVTVEEYGWEAGAEGLYEILVGQTEGWTLVLAGLKAYLEHNIRLDLVGDHNPEALKEGV